MSVGFYGWRIVGVAFLTHCITTGIVFYTFGVFLLSLTEEFGWSRAEVSVGFSLASLCGALYAPFVGRAVDRFGPRPSQLLGAVAMATGFWLLAGMESLLGFYLVMGLPVSLGSTALGPLPSNTAVARWFVRQRGKALGIATTGISMGGVIFVPLTQWLIDRTGWRDTFLLLGALILVVTVPPVALFMRRSPESMGLAPDGDGVIEGQGGIDLERETQRSWTPREALRHRNFWLITAAFALTIAGLSATLLHQITFLGDRGVDADEAAWVLGATAGMGVLGKIGFGALLDRLRHDRVILWCFGIQAIGLLFLVAPTNGWTLCAYVVVYGFAMGGNATLQATVVGECFGRLHYGTIAGRMMPFIVFSQAIAIPIAGAIRDELGTYVPAFGLIIAANLLAMLCVSGLEPNAAPHRRSRA